MPMRPGFTLVELIVVLVLIGLTLGLIAPALRPPAEPSDAGLAPVLRLGRLAAVRRGEPVTVRIEPGGAWRADARIGDEAIAVGTLASAPGRSLTLIFSPLGTCAADVRSSALGVPALDPLTCEPRPQ